VDRSRQAAARAANRPSEPATSRIRLSQVSAGRMSNTQHVGRLTAANRQVAEDQARRQQPPRSTRDRPAKRGADHGRHSQTKSEKERPVHRSCDSAHARDGESRKRVPGISVVFERTYILPITAISSRPISNSGCYYSVGTWKNPHMFPGTGAQVWCPGGTRLIHMQHALYWRRPGGPASLYMSSPITSWGYTSNTGQWGYVNVGCPLGSWQWQPSVLIWINNQYMGNFGGNWGGFTACVVLQP
jgi:hypothetical protein